MSQIEKIARIIEPEAWKWHDRDKYADRYASEREASLQKAKDILSVTDIEADLAVVNKLIWASQLTVVVETPEGSNCCPVVSANLNGDNIDVWLDEKFGNEITPDKENEVNSQLKAMIRELIEVYWGEGDSDPHNPPDIIKRAERLLKST